MIAQQGVGAALVPRRFCPMLGMKKHGIRQVSTEARFSRSTLTRIWAPDEKTRKKFAIYWRIISLGSGWIRIMWLKAIKRRAEKAQGSVLDEQKG